MKRRRTGTLHDFRLSDHFSKELGDKVRASPHFAEGVAAFREKRQPRYE